MVVLTPDTPLPALEPPDDLVFALDAALEMRTLIAGGMVEYSLVGINRWLNGASTARENRVRFTKVEAIRRLLGGEKLPAAELRFADAYRDYLLRTPAARASALVAREALRHGVALTGLRPEALAVLLA